MKFLLLIFLTSSWAYAPKDISISDVSFRRYVIPQLRSINSEFKTFLFTYNEKLSSFKSSYTHFYEIEKIRDEIFSSCITSKSDACQENLKEIRKQNFSLIKDLKTIETDNKNIRSTIQMTIQEVMSLNLSIENHLVFKELDKNSTTLEIEDILIRLDNLSDQFHMALFSLTDPKLKNEITVFWTGFIKPVRKYVLNMNKKEYFIRNLNQLNLDWNLLNLRLTKRNIKLTKKLKTVVSVMHNRWNRVLKVSLVTK